MISIGLPFYNNEKTLDSAIRSVFAQTYQDWELILVDDGSTDRSLEIAESVEDSRIRIISDGENKKLPARLNQITSVAKGDFIARMDADDIMHPDRLETQLLTLVSNPNTDCISSPIYTIDNRNDLTGKRGFFKNDLFSPTDFFDNRVIVHPTFFARTEWFKRNRYRNFMRAQDHELWCRSYLNNDFKMKRTKKALLFYREEGSVKLSKILKSYQSECLIRKTYGPLLAGRYYKNRKIIALYLKMVVSLFIFGLGMQKKLISFRNQRLTKKELYEAQASLDFVLETNVAGLDSIT